MNKKHLKILYIEDDLGSRALVRKILEPLGHRIIEVEDGISGIKKAQEEVPDLILMDINIPDMDGYETTTKLKSIKDLANVPIIAVTADVMKGDREMALTAGCDGFIQKPIDPYNFSDQIEEFLSGKKEKVEEKVETAFLKEYSKKLVDRLEKKIEELIKINKELEDKVRERTADLEEANKRLKQLTITDELTGLYNRRYLERQLNIEFQRSKRFDHNISLIMFDLDDFKKLNDTYGHLFGDTVLCEVAKILKGNVREIDFVIRYGGEEFVLLLPLTDIKRARSVSERIRSLVEDAHLETKEDIKLTVSAGFANYPADNISSRDDLIFKADQALYQAKRNGKNLVRGWKDIASPN